MENFDAKQAKEVTNSFYKEELYNILIDIKKEAKCGKSILCVRHPLNELTIDKLVEKGFRVDKNSHFSIVQRETFHHYIHW